MTGRLLVGDVHRDVVRVTGGDAASFLQGQLSQDVEAMAVGDTRATFVLQPQGKVDVWGRVTRLGDDEFELDVDAGSGTDLLERLNRFKLRVDVTFEALDPVVIDDEEDDDHEARRIAAGVPRMGREVSDTTIPAELGQWVIDESVSFTKGCFTGQELVARIDSRGGHVPRQLRVIDLDLDGDAAPPPGAALTVDGAPAGTLTSVAGATALAFVPRAIEVPATAAVEWDGGHATAAIRAPA
jgi:tRNA-modifying protein YgfZ